MNIPRAGIAAAVVVLLLSGCATGAEPADPPVAETPTETPAPEPTKPALDELILSPDGLGPLVIGQEPPVTDPELDVLVFDEDYCAEYVASGERDEPGMWLANYDRADGEKYLDRFAVLVIDGELRAVQVNDVAIRTADGLGLGSSLDELLAAHPDARKIAGEHMDLYVITGQTGRLVFEVGTVDAIGYEPGTIGIVTVGPIDSEPVSIANSDAGLGACIAA